MNNTNKNLLVVMAQGFYGNKTMTEIKLENLDRFILGYIDNSIMVTEKVDRTIINIPNTNIVVIYNKYEEEKKLKVKEALKPLVKPLVSIPEKNIKIYSRCIVCRMNESGELEDLQHNDYNKINKYLSE